MEWTSSFLQKNAKIKILALICKDAAILWLAWLRQATRPTTPKAQS